MHDKPIADTTSYPLAEGSELPNDLGFLGYVLPGVQHTLPIKKPKGRDLTPEEKAYNQSVAQRRIVVEHIISSVKRCRIVKDSFAFGKKACATSLMKICCGLHNFRSHHTVAIFYVLNRYNLYSIPWPISWDRMSRHHRPITQACCLRSICVNYSGIRLLRKHLLFQHG